MNPFAAAVVKTVGAAGVAVLLGAGAVSAVGAASPSPSPTPKAGTTQPSNDRHADARAVRKAEIEAEADVLGISPQTLVKDLKDGQKVSDLARDKGLTKEQFADRLAAALKPRLEQLVDAKVITQAQADKVLDRIAKGHIPFWNGIHTRKK